MEGAAVIKKTAEDRPRDVTSEEILKDINSQQKEE